MSAHLRRPAHLRLARRAVAPVSVLTLGLLLAAGATPAAAVLDPGPVNLVPQAAAGNGKKDAGAGGQGTTNQGNQGTPPGQGNHGNQGNQGNTDPGGNTPGNNDPGTNDAGRPNGGTGANPGGGGAVDPSLGSATRFELRLTSSGAVPPALDRSGAEFSFVDATTSVSAGTCTTEASGTCTVHWGVAAPTGDASVVVLPYGAYEIIQTTAPAGLTPVDGGIGRFSFCVVLCDVVGEIPVTNASLFRTRVVATVLDDERHPVPGREFSLRGAGDYAGADTSDADGTLAFDGWFAPGSWTFTPTTPDGFATLPSQEHTLITTPAEAADPWAVQLRADALEPLTPELTEEQGTGGTAGAGGTGTTAGTGTTGDENGADPSSDGVPGAGDPGTKNPGTGDPVGGDSDVVDSGNGDPVVVPGDEAPDTGKPGKPVTGNPGIDDSASSVSGTGGSGNGGGTTGSWADAGDDGETYVEDPTGDAVAPAPSPGSAVPSRRPADVGASPLLAEAPQLETVSFREAGLVSSGFVLVALVVLGFLLYRRRSRRLG